MQKWTNRSIVIFIIVAATMTGCVAVKPYQRAYLNDEGMQLGKTSLDKSEDNAHSYREGSSGGGSGKGSGGCGCN